MNRSPIPLTVRQRAVCGRLPVPVRRIPPPVLVPELPSPGPPMPLPPDPRHPPPKALAPALVPGHRPSQQAGSADRRLDQHPLLVNCRSRQPRSVRRRHPRHRPLGICRSQYPSSTRPRTRLRRHRHQRVVARRSRYSRPPRVRNAAAGGQLRS
ncbi:hypothetical protein ACRAWF_18055 [Streptomyces sp. L7]